MSAIPTDRWIRSFVKKLATDRLGNNGPAGAAYPAGPKPITAANMARISIDSKQKLVKIEKLKMPDGSYRTYRDIGRNAIARIIRCWRKDSRQMLLDIEADLAAVRKGGESWNSIVANQ